MVLEITIKLYNGQSINKNSSLCNTKKIYITSITQIYEIHIQVFQLLNLIKHKVNATYLQFEHKTYLRNNTYTPKVFSYLILCNNNIRKRGEVHPRILQCTYVCTTCSTVASNVFNCYVGLHLRNTVQYTTKCSAKYMRMRRDKLLLDVYE